MHPHRILLVALATLALAAAQPVVAAAQAPTRHHRVQGDALVGAAAGTDRAIWKRFTRLIPAEQREELVAFSVFGGDGPTDAYVVATLDDPTRWRLAVHSSLAWRADADAVLIHEYAHLLTLRASQVPPDDRVGGCSTIHTGEGCALPQSYIARYVRDFWGRTGHLRAWRRADALLGARARERALERFYLRRRRGFVNEYAASAPWEDIAESFTRFVLRPEPVPGPLARRKVRFFSRFPELVELRERIRASRRD